MKEGLVQRAGTMPAWLSVPLIAFVITRVFTAAAVNIADRIPFDDSEARAQIMALPNIPDIEVLFGESIFDNSWARLDGLVYISIADGGYTYTARENGVTGFFPLYPLLIRLVSIVTGDPISAGLLISHAAFFAALVLLYRLCLHEFNDRHAAARTIFYIAAFPTAFFFSAVYTESLFLLLSVLVFYAARHRRWLIAIAAATLASAARIQGVILVGVIALEWMESHGWHLETMHRAETWHNLAVGIRRQSWVPLLIPLGALGLIMHMLYLNAMFGDPFAFVGGQIYHHRGLDVGLLSGFAASRAEFSLSEHPFTSIRFLLNVGALLMVFISFIPIWRRLGKSYALYSLLYILQPALTHDHALIRYVVVVFPVFMWFGLWIRDRRFDIALRVIGLAGIAGIAFLFVKWFFIA